MKRFGEPSHEKRLKIAERIVGLTGHVSLTGGEPLILGNQLRELVDTLIDNYGVTVSMVTNLTLADEETLSFLSDRGVYLYVSVEAASKEVHERIRPGSWDRVLKGLKNLRDLGVEYSTITTLNKLNYGSAWRVLGFADEFHADCSCYIPIIPIGRAAESNLMPTPGQLLEAHRRVVEEAENGGYYARFWCSPTLKPYASSRRVSVHGCSRGSLDVTPNGDILLCDTLDIVVSNVFKDPWEIVWDCEESPEARMFEEIPEDCMGCEFKPVCRGGCKSRAYNVYGSMTKPDPLCPLLNG